MIMGEIGYPSPVVLLIAATSRHAEALNWARERCAQSRGPLKLISEPLDFKETDYYTAMMGTGLKKQFLAFERPVDPAALAEIKRETNEWEAEYAAFGKHAEPRPLNLDPGYITAAKLVLASTKDHAHRIYLRDGIYAEITLVFRQRHWQPLDWTYPDYRRADYHQFFDRCRERVLNCGSRTDGVK
jgi:hypothetical protein